MISSFQLSELWCNWNFSQQFPLSLLLKSVKLNFSSALTSTSGSSATVTVDLVALDTAPIAVGGSVVLTALIFGIKVEEVSPLSTLVTATGSIIKI